MIGVRLQNNEGISYNTLGPFFLDTIEDDQKRLAPIVKNG
jgi:hypothetical protein